jgi:hypothetical protein
LPEAPLETGFLVIVGDTVAALTTALALTFSSLVTGAAAGFVAETVLCVLLSPRGGARVAATTRGAPLLDTVAPLAATARFYTRSNRNISFAMPFTNVYVPERPMQ